MTTFSRKFVTITSCKVYKKTGNTFRRKFSAILFISCFVFLALFPEKSDAADDLFYKGNEEAEPYISEFILERDFKDEAASYPKYFKSVTKAGKDYKPNFLYNRQNGFRVVEFYAQWCGHCQHYKPEYIQLAKNVTEKMPNITFYAVSCVNYADVCKLMDVHGYPTVLIFEENSVKNVAPSRLGITAESIIKLASKGSAPTTEEKKETNVSNETKIIATPHITKTKATDAWSPLQNGKPEDIISDAMLSLDYSLRTGVYTNLGSLSLVKKEALTEWLNLLSESLPTKWKVHATIDDLLAHIDMIAKEESSLKEILDDHELDQKDWSASCQKGDVSAGYTCGLWELFHIMTIGMVEQNRHLNDTDRKISTLHAAETLRNFISNFFLCSECVTHFLTMYDSCTFQNCDTLTDDKDISSMTRWMQLPLWLWQAHNDVNVRLKREARERNLNVLTDSEDSVDRITAEWPSRQQCTDCWDEDGGFKEQAMYDFLKKTYWPSESIMMSIKATPGYQNHPTAFVVFSILFFLAVAVWYVTASCMRVFMRLCVRCQILFTQSYSREFLFLHNFVRKWNLYQRDANDSSSL